ncbi:uncharacterized protein A1O5_12035 [Cladophialophora psammophila CBS 110553]|uniref:Uncharacterized protein n=1 Tax=Cladophialophora psammophila CBS 110553 TaxID=1182543 RepID=W9VZW8_9EURO|nr:uncharacterized protein A1O5_12035 [Cladophialophora psammophila CBS 110553]EXJ61243.1 hypothetical protein A1O5_12035 [Cladophialophora psammophila CBS 110553]
MVRWLIDHGANLSARGLFDITPLSIAAKSASKEVTELLVKLGASTEEGQPLHCAVAYDSPGEIILLVFKNGAPINESMFQEHKF